MVQLTVALNECSRFLLSLDFTRSGNIVIFNFICFWHIFYTIISYMIVLQNKIYKRCIFWTYLTIFTKTASFKLGIQLASRSSWDCKQIYFKNNFQNEFWGSIKNNTKMKINPHIFYIKDITVKVLHLFNDILYWQQYWIYMYIKLFWLRKITSIINHSMEYS